VEDRFDKQGRLWGVENGIDNVFRADLGGDIHENNPSEELNLFFPELPGITHSRSVLLCSSGAGRNSLIDACFVVVVGLFYGYPYCWSQYNLTITGKPPGTQWATDKFLHDGTHTLVISQFFIDLELHHTYTHTPRGLTMVGLRTTGTHGARTQATCRSLV
jgi:hypothetical protein